MRMLLAIITVLLLSPATARAQQFREGDTVPVSPDRGYVLMRLPERSYNVLLMRYLTPEQLDKFDAARRAAFEAAKPKADADRAKIIADNAKGGTKKVPDELTLDTFVFRYDLMANVLIMKAKYPFATDTTGKYYLFGLPPGTYAIIGMSFTGGGEHMNSCACMGSVKFEVKPGRITDMGLVLTGTVGAPVEYPELADYTGKTIVHPPQPVPGAIGLRPYDPAMPRPATLPALPIEVADYRAQGRIPNFFYSMITRMAPVKGVLDYKLDKIIDVKSGEEVP